MQPRQLLFCFLAVFAVSHAWLLHRNGWNDTWRRWQVPARTPHFSDLRVITGAADSRARGFNPREENPAAPYGQEFNQTSVWYWLEDLGVREADTTAVGLVLIAGLFIGLWWACAGIDSRTAWLLVPLILSPPTILAIERGTTDLSVFFLLALAGHLAGRAAVASQAAVLAAFALKLFPLAGVALLLREPPRRAARIAAVVLGLGALFIAANFDDLRDIGRKTEMGGKNSYGWSVLANYFAEEPPTRPALARPVRWSYGALCAAALIGAVWAGRRRPVAARVSAGRPLDFFRLGAAVYVGTYLLGASWDYRLIFTVFMVPQLVAWTRERDGLRVISWLVLATLAGAAWSMALGDGLSATATGRFIARTFEETTKGALFIGSVYLLVASAPAWLRRPPAADARPALPSQRSPERSWP